MSARSAESSKEEVLLSSQQFNELKFNPIIPVSAIGIDKSVIDFWRREGLMPFMEKGKWAKLNFVQTIWLLMLNSIRNFGMPVKTLKHLTDYFIKRAYTSDLPKQNLEYNKKQLEKKRQAKTITDREEDLLKVIERTLQDPILLYMFKWDVNYFSNLITEIVTLKLEGAVLIFEDQTIAVEVCGSYQTFPEKELNLKMPHLYIPLTYYLEEFIDSEELSQYLSKIHMLNEDEQRVIREVRNKNVREIKIMLGNDKSGSKSKINKIEATKAGVISEDKAKEVRRILGIGNYERIEIKTIDEKSLSFKNTKIKVL